MNEPGVCVLVLNWNGADDTLDCLQSLQKLTYPAADAVVIDNGSSDDSVSRIKSDFPDTHIIELSSNLFFGGGNNAGLEWAQTKGYEYVIFLNNDTTVEPDFIEPLLACFESFENVGIVAPLMCYASDPQLIWYGGGRVNLWTGTVEHKHIRKSLDVVGTQALTTDYITGCCLMMKTDLAVEMAGFHPDFKMYGEDVDLSLRCREAGYQLIFAPQGKIYHKVSASVGGEFGLKKLSRKLGGLLKLYSRHAAWYQLPSILFFQAMFSLKHLLTYAKHKYNSGTKV